jgi:hypothetical protein
MAKKETKMTKTEIIDKIIKTVEYLIAPVTAVLAIWDVDCGVYVVGRDDVDGLRCFVASNKHRERY